MVPMSLADNILTVSELNYRVKSTLEAQHGMVKAQGEVSNDWPQNLATYTLHLKTWCRNCSV